MVDANKTVKAKPDAKLKRAAKGMGTAPGKGLKSRLADGFVMMAMALVALALCLGLVLQGGLSFWLSVTVSLALYAGLLTTHALVRRAGQIEELRAELDRLKSDVARIGAAGDRLAGASDAVPAAPKSVPAGPATAAAPVHATHPGAGSGSNQAGIAVPQRPAASGSAMALHPRAGEPGVAAHMRGGAAAAPNTMDEPRGMGAPLPPAATSATPPSLPTGRAAAGPEAGPARAATSGVAGRMANIIRAPSAPPESATGTPPAADGGRMSPSGAALEGALPRGAVAPAAPQRVERTGPAGQAAASQRMPEAGASQRPETEAGDGDDVWSYRPGGAGAADEISPREADVEMIQGLIKKLAAEVGSAGVAQPPAGRAGDNSAREADIERSVGALREAANSMRGHQPAASPPAPAPASAPASAQSSGPSDADFDVEALMRRAQPIATMTTVPPPLPAASGPVIQRAGGRDQSDFESDTELEYAALGSAGPDRQTSPGYGPEDDAAGADAWADRAIADAMAGPGEAGHVAEAEDEASAAGMNRQIDPKFRKIAEALEAGRIDVFLEPILDLEKNQARHYEVALRLTDDEGAPIVVEPVAAADRTEAVLPLLDCMRLDQTAYLAQRLEERGKTGSVFSAFQGVSLTSDDFLSSLADVVSERESLAGQLVLTFAQDDVRRFRAPEWSTLVEMRDFGFRFALRAVTDLDMDFDELTESGFAFVKLDADVFLDGMPAPGAVLPAADICKYFAERSLSLVVEHIDDDAKRARVFGFGALLGQGQLFGGPRRMKAPQINNATRSAAA